MSFLNGRRHQEIAAGKTFDAIGTKAGECDDAFEAEFGAKSARRRTVFAVASDEKKTNMRMLPMDKRGGAQEYVGALLPLQRPHKSDNGAFGTNEQGYALSRLRSWEIEPLERVGDDDRFRSQ